MMLEVVVGGYGDDDIEGIDNWSKSGSDMPSALVMIINYYSYNDARLKLLESCMATSCVSKQNWRKVNNSEPNDLAVARVNPLKNSENQKKVKYSGQQCIRIE